MQEIAACTFTYEAFPEVMGMLWKRMLHDNNKQNWRRIYKSLLLLDYLIKNGSERVVTSAREHIYDLRSLENFTFVDENGKDQGINIRHKVGDMLEFVQDDDRLREERKKRLKRTRINMWECQVTRAWGSGQAEEVVVAGTVDGRVLTARQVLVLGEGGVEEVMMRTGGMIQVLRGSRSSKTTVLALIKARKRLACPGGPAVESLIMKA